MKKILLIILLALLPNLFAQDDPPPPPQNTWLPNGVLGLNLSQLALKDWTQGGEDALSFVVYSNFGLDYFTDPWAFTNKLKISFGRTKLGSDDFRTTDNEIFMENLLVYDANWFANPYFSNTLRTVIAKGYDYSDDQKVQIAEFFDPGYLHQSIGLAYKPSESFMTRFGVAIEETFTNKFRSFSDDEETTDEVEKFKLEEGIESVSNLNLKLDDDLLYTSELRLFGSFQKFDEWDVRWDNILTAQVTKLVNVNFNVLLIYDTDQIAKTQLKEALQIGITYTLF
jgi:hypothetical protein